MTPTVGLLGYGEAGQHIAAGLVEEGVAVVVYDVRFDEDGGDLRARTVRAGIAVADGPRDLAGCSDVVLGVVPGDRAMEAAEAIAGHLKEGHTYVDLSSIGPERARQVSDVVSQGEGRFVDGAIMAAVPPHGHRVPILLAGGDATAVAERLSAAGMRVDIVNDVVGAASAAKMFRSLLVKGLEALIVEALVAASEWDASDAVLTSMRNALPSDDWSAIASYFLGRTLSHADRRHHELEEVARTVAACGIEPLMARAAADRMAWVAGAVGGTGHQVASPGDHHDAVRLLTAQEHAR